jgi:hypothetical protein
VIAQQQLTDSSRDILSRVLLKLSTTFNYIPSKLLVSGVTLVSHDPSYAGGFADIFRGTYESKPVAVKRFRDFLPGHSPAALDKVCLVFSSISYDDLSRFGLSDYIVIYLCGSLWSIPIFYPFSALMTRPFQHAFVWCPRRCRMANYWITSINMIYAIVQLTNWCASVEMT